MPAPLYRNVHLADGGILSVAALDLQPQQVLSTAMPTPAQVGMLAYATDTFQLLQYQSATTGWTQLWNMPWGRVAEGTATSNQTGITAEVDVASVTASFVAVANRRIKVTMMLSVSQSTNAGTLTAKIVSGAGAGTTVQQNAVSLVVNGSGNLTLVTPTLTPAAGSVTYHGRISSNASSGNVNGSLTAPATIIVEDIGPSANPA